MTEFLNVDGGTLAYEVTGASGPLIVLAHGMGDSRAAYRFVAPALVDAGYRVAVTDLRGTGESSAEWPSYSRTDIAGDLIALITHLGGPAVLVGHSISGGAATIAAATTPALITAVVELAPFTRPQSIAFGDLGVARFRRGMTALLGAGLFGSVGQWKKYLDIAHPGRKPADWDARLAEIEAMLRQPGRMKALQKMGQTTPADAGAQLANVRCPVLVVQGTLDPDWASPRAEGEAIVAALPAGLGRLEMIEGAGHYPHVQYPAEVVTAMLSFLSTARA
ncbi:MULTISPECIES: alpha/beta fold hydrolase [Catenuloplanes]|uniref:Pimeloyl-ACP methyl ester carboxylesterase n=1 Tax=Catenuloplanes niger TaxID=587534 RepID=A0AAE3ZMK6_9ACTN|nr:alpha/beta hydrolase [Catenuloplanes niger]MDR7321534.1 pimeloyl-ACP methyl ester carboxylesterase [Catenuloplanes niger]